MVLALEGRILAAEHGSTDGERVLEHLEALLHRWEVDAECHVLDVEPGGADAEERPAAGDDVECGHLLGEDRGVPVGHSGDQRAEHGRLGASRERAQQGVGLEHLGVGRAEEGELEEVVHDHDGVEAALLAGGGHGRHSVEELVRADSGVGEARDLEAGTEHEHMLACFRVGRTPLAAVPLPDPGV